MRAQDKRRVEAYWNFNQTPEQAAWALNVPLDEVQAIFKKLNNRPEFQDSGQAGL